MPGSVKGVRGQDNNEFWMKRIEDRMEAEQIGNEANSLFPQFVVVLARV